MKVAVFSLLVAACLAGPIQHHQSGLARHHVDVPEGCLFLESSERQEGDLTIGEYSYLDPRGSLVTVSWTDGPVVGYNEKRRVIKNYESGVSVATGTVVRVSTEQLVTEILGELQSTVVETVRTALRGVDVSGTSVNVIVSRLMTKLQPVIRSTVIQVLSRNQVTDIDVDSLMLSITGQLQSFVTQTVETTIASTPATLPAVQVPVTQQVSDEEFLAKLIAQLKPVIVSTVQSNLKTSQTTKQPLLPPPIQTKPSKPVVIPAPLPSKPVVIPAPIPSKPVTIPAPIPSRPVVSGVTTTVETSSSSVDSGNLVTDIVSRLKPLILSQISRLTASQQQSTVTVTKPKPVVTVTKPVVTINVEEVRAKLITRIIGNLRPALGEAITRTIRSANTNNEEELVRLIIAEMKPVILTTIKSTVTAEETQQLGIFTNSQSFNRFVSTIISRLRPVVAESVRIVVASQVVNVEEVREEVIARIITELRVTLGDVITRTIQSAGDLNEERLVALIITEIRPVIVSTLRTSVSQQEAQQLGLFATSSSLDAFVDQIIVRLRVVISQSVRSLIEVRQAELQAQRQAELEAQRLAQLEAQRQAELEAQRQAQLEAQRQAQLEAQRQAQLEAQRQAQLEAQRQAQLEAQRQAQLVASTRTAVITRVVTSVSGSLRQTVSAIIASAGTREESVLVGMVTDDVRLLVEEAVRSLVTDQEAQLLGLVSQSAVDQLVAEILIQMRAAIVQMVQTVLVETKVTVTTTTTTQGDLTKVFGVSGANFVKVDTPAFNYGYEH